MVCGLGLRVIFDFCMLAHRTLVLSSFPSLSSTSSFRQFNYLDPKPCTLDQARSVALHPIH